MLILIHFTCSALGLSATMVFLSDVFHSRINLRKMAVIAVLLSLLIIPEYVFAVSASFVTVIHAIMLIAFVVILFVCFQGIRLRQLIVFEYFFLLFLLSGMIASTLVELRYREVIYVLNEPVQLLVHDVLKMTVYILMGSLSVFARRIIVDREFQAYFLLFFILPVGQIITVYSFMFTTWTAYWVLGVLLCLVADLVLLVYTIAQEKKLELEEELRETRHQMELEQTHYQAVEQRRDELAKIRNDFNGQLVSVAQLVHSGEECTAQALIRSLAEEINQTKENPYCAIPVVNAILTEKAQECAQSGIGLEVELDIPARLTVASMHLCSIFSNLLDNAIAACKLVEERNPTIHLTSKVDGDYLFIKTANPSAEPPKTPMPGRGYGSRILSDLAARYGGNYQSAYRDGVFTAVSSLLALER